MPPRKRAAEKKEETVEETPVDAAPAQESRDQAQDAAPVQGVGTEAALSAQPVTSGRDKSMDAKPAFVSPPTSEPEK